MTLKRPARTLRNGSNKRRPNRDQLLDAGRARFCSKVQQNFGSRRA